MNDNTTDITNNNTNNDNSGERPHTSRLHPRVYLMIVGLAIWLVLSVWIFMGSGVTDYLLFVVSGFVFVAVALPFTLSLVAARADAPRDAAPSFRDWTRSEFETWQGHLSGTNAVVEILLPIAAVAFGMTAFGIAMLYATHGMA